jgi:TonB family protein
MSSFFRLGLFASALCLALPLFAQHQLFAIYDNKALLVVAGQARGAVVMLNGERRVLHPDSFSLLEGGAYLPAYVSISNLKATTFSMESFSGTDVNKSADVKCTFITSYDLEDVFFILFVENEKKEKFIFFHEVGRLKDRVPRDIDIRVPIKVENLEGHFQLYVFSKGYEVFHSAMSPEIREQALDKIIAAQLKDVQEAQAKPLVGPGPEYPKALRGQKLEGKAKLKFTIDPKGVIHDPSVVEATCPEFGEAAMAVILKWRFFPKIKDGKPVSTPATMPFMFRPPGKAVSK